MDKESKEARNSYYRDYYKKNKSKYKQTQGRYWKKKYEKENLKNQEEKE